MWMWRSRARSIAAATCLVCASWPAFAAPPCPESILTLTDLLGGMAAVPSDGLDTQRLLSALDQLTLHALVPHRLDVVAGVVGEQSGLTSQGVASQDGGALLLESRSLFLAAGARNGISTSLGSAFQLGAVGRAHAVWQPGAGLGAALTAGAPLCVSSGPLSVVMPRIGLDYSWTPEAEADRQMLRLVPGGAVGVFQRAGSAVVALRGGLSLGLYSPFSVTDPSSSSDSIGASVEVLVFHRSIFPRVPALVSTRAGVQSLLLPEAASASDTGLEPALATSAWTWSSVTRLLLAPKLSQTVGLGGALELELAWLPEAVQSSGAGGRVWLDIALAHSWRMFLEANGRAAQITQGETALQQISTFGWSALVSYAF